MDHKFTENPFSSRKPPAQNINRTMALSQRSQWLGPLAYTFGLVACGVVLAVTVFSSSLPNNHVALVPLSASDRPPFRPAGLRGQARLVLLKTNNNEESPLKASSIVDTPLSDVLDEDVEKEDVDEEEEDEAVELDHNPQYIMPLRKFLGTRQQAAQREHHEIHDQVQDHIFGQNRSGSTAVKVEEDPSVIIKDWESDSEDAKDELVSAEKQVTKEDKEEVETATATEEKFVLKKKH